MTKIGSTFLIRAAAFTFAAGVVLSAIEFLPLALVSGPSSTAQVGVQYTSGFTASGGQTPYTFAITSGALPGGLNLNTSTGAVTGLPNTAGTFTFSGRVTDSQSQQLAETPAAATGTAVAKKRLLASGNNAASVTNSFTITVAPAAPSPTPVPPSVWMALTGLAGAGMAGLRKRRRA